MRTINVVEGCSGSGKTSYLRQISNGEYIESTYAHGGARFSFDEDAPIKSYLKDTDKMVKALTEVTPESYIDRYYLSQQVYQAIRDDGRSVLEREPWTKEVVLNVLKEMHDSISCIVKGLVLRGAIILTWEPKLHIMNPRYDVLKKMRNGCERAYPCDNLDWYLYHHFAERIKQLGQSALPFDVEIVEIPYDEESYRI